MKSFLLVLFSAFLFQKISIAEDVKNNKKDTPLMKQERGVMVVSHGSTTIKRNVVKENAQKSIEQEKQRQIVKQKNEERKKQQKELQKVVNGLNSVNTDNINTTNNQQVASNVAQFANQPILTGLEDKEQTSMFADVFDVIKVVMDAYKDLYNDNIKQGATPAHPSITGAYAKMYNILDKFSQYVYRGEDKNLKK